MWWPALVLGYLAMNPTAGGAELGALGVPLAGLSAIVAVLGRRATRSAVGPPAEMRRTAWRLLRRLPRRVLVDSGRLLAVLMTDRAGTHHRSVRRTHRVTEAPDAELGPVAVASVLTGVTPGSYPVDAAPERGTLVVRELRP